MNITKIMRTFFRDIPNDLKHISTLIIGNGFSIFIPVLVSPVITRMYTAADFGVFTIYTAMITLISSFASGRYDYAMLMAKSRKNAQQLFKVSLGLAGIICMIVLVIVLLFNDSILRQFNVESMGGYLYLIPLNIFLFAIIQITQNGLNREKKYEAISMGKTIRSFFVGGVQVGLGALGVLNGGLILGKITGDLFSSTYLTKQLNKIERYLTSALSFNRVSYLIKKYDRFPKVNAPHAFVSAMSLSLTPMIIGYFFSEDIVGFYGLAYTVCVLPVQLVGRAFYQVFSQKAAVMFNQGEGLVNYTKKTLKLLFIISIIPFAVLTVLGPEIFGFVFGAEWVTSGKLVQILAPFLFLVFLLNPLIYIPLIYEEQKKSFYFEIILFLSRITALVVGARLGDIYFTIILFTVVSILVQAVNLFWITSLTKKYNPEA